MDVVIRVDGSSSVGIGHLTRCLTLAQEIVRSEGSHVRAVSAQIPLAVAERFEQAGCSVLRLKDVLHGEGGEERDAAATRLLLEAHGGVDWIVVDHYGLSRVWECLVSPLADRILVIDDLADRKHCCDVLLDQNLHPEPDQRYAGLVPDTCMQLLGPRWALLRDEFFAARRRGRYRDGAVRRVLVSFGGADPTDETSKVILALRHLQGPERIDVVTGPGFRRADAVQDLAARDKRVYLYHSPGDMAALMESADLAVGACGTTTWERCLLGLPTVVLTIAENQSEMAAILSNMGAILHLGRGAQVSQAEVASAVRALSQDPERVRNMGLAASSIMLEAAGPPE